MSDDIRWIQRLHSFEKSLESLDEVYRISEERVLSRIELQALVKSFELCYETGWNLMKDWFEYQGVGGITGSRDAVRTAFTNGLIEDGETWMDMVRNRNRTAHTYNEGVAREVADLIIGKYFTTLHAFRDSMRNRLGSEIK